MDIYELMKKYKIGEEGEDKKGFEKEFKELFAGKGEVEQKQNEIETLNEQIKELNTTVKKFDGVDVEGLKQSLKDNEIKYKKEIEQLRLNSALELELYKSKAKNTKAVKALLDLDLIKLQDGKISGLQEQIENLKKSDDYLFTSEGNNQEGMEGLHPPDSGDDSHDENKSAGAMYAQNYNSMFGIKDGE